MHTVFWSAKGGSGVTTIAAAVALAAPDCLFVDLCGDAALALGIDEPPIGLFAWLHATQDVDTSALDRLIVAVRPGLALLPAGTTRPEAPANAAIVTERLTILASYLSLRSHGAHSSARGRIVQQPRSKQRVRVNMFQTEPSDQPSLSADMQWSNIVVDAGSWSRNDSSNLEAILHGADRSVIVVKSCFLAVHATVAMGHRGQGLVVVCDEERRITDTEIAAALGLPVLTTVVVHPAVARAVDAGLLVARLPRTFTRSLEALQPKTESVPLNRRTLRNVRIAS